MIQKKTVLILFVVFLFVIALAKLIELCKSEDVNLCSTLKASRAI